MTITHSHNLELHFSEESPHHFRACAMENGNVAAQHKFELHTGELKLIEGLHRLEKNSIAPLAKEKETFHIELGKKLYTQLFADLLSDPDCIKIDEIKPITAELLHEPQMLLNVQVMCIVPNVNIRQMKRHR